ncbi:MAG: LURP-one-related family protein [Candidatus Izimaplasma sp.]|nr:LURP-one-related family protein [Candidatus Izimaplasma bacterium]
MKFYIKQKVFSLKDKFNILDKDGKEIYQVEGKMFSLSNELFLKNLNGSLIFKAKKKIFSFLPNYTIVDPHNQILATVKKKFSLRPKFNIEIGNDHLDLEGSLFQHNFTLKRGQQEIAQVKKKVISFGDSYEIDILREDHTELYLFLVILLDQILHEKERGS